MKSNIIRSLSAIFFIFTLSLMSCSKTDEKLPDEPVPINLTQDQVSLIKSGNSFAFDIFKKVLEGAGESENVMISPLSISYALSMTLNGADGATREAMLEALRLNGISVDAINNSYKKLTEALLSVDKRVLMSIANSVWIENNFTVKKSFTDILTNYYDAESGSFDINDASAPDKINAWIEDKTNGLIKEMIDKLEDNTVMLLVNAIYFKGKWKSQFDASKTVPMPFYKTGSSPVDVPMMKQKTDFSVFEGNGFVLAEFPYGQGNFVMDVILPGDQSGLSSMITQVSDASFTGWISQMDEREIDLSFPKFKYGFKKKLKDVLTDMGMGIAFYEGADFSNINDVYDLLINDVTHQSFIETNEEGTEAAAATIVDIGLTSMPPAPLVLKLDHPFLYIIRETTTNSIIFMGRVANPSVN
jgi:serine protease inhibitor